MSGVKPEAQNRMCLECPADGEREAWHGSAHGYERLFCSSCHSSHDPLKISS